MCVFCVTACVFFMFLCANCDINLKDNVSALLPPIFYIDRNYEKCKDEGKLFCKINVVLSPITSESNVSSYWKFIEKSMENRRAYNRSELFHAICINDYCEDMKTLQEGDILMIQDKLSECYTKKYRKLGLKANVTVENCSSNRYHARTFDYMWLSLVLIYGTYIIYASIWDYHFRKRMKKEAGIMSISFGKFVVPFSVISNWEKLKKENTNPDFQKLKCIQGIRFYNMLLIIFCHTYSSFVGGYVQNTTYIEEIGDNFIKLGLRNLMVFLVQTFFLISAFLLSYHMFQVIERTKVFSKRDIILTFLNRYLRIIPPVLVMIGLGSSIWIVSLFRGPIKDIYSDVEYQRCQKNWWTTLLFINNHYNQHDMCYFITWYLAADTQLYILSLIIFSVIWILRNKTKTILTICIGIGIVIPMAISYIYNLDIIYRITPENAKNNKFRSFLFNAIYSSTYANMATYMIGLYTGYVYFTKKNDILLNTKFHTHFWWIGFFGLPIFVITLSSYYYNRLIGAIICGILKPLFALGIGIGILGMSQQRNGLVKRICEWRPAIFLGNLTYSTYLVHYGIVFYRTATAKQPLYVSDYVLVTSFFYDTLISLFCGFLMHILVEMPVSQLQNILVPQVRTKRTPYLNSKTQ